MARSISAEKIWKPALLIAAVAFAYWSVLTHLGRFWWEDENYSHGLLIPFIIGFILWTERENLSRLEKRPRPGWGAAGVLVALFALWAGTAGAELFLQRISFALLLAAIAVYFWGFKLLRALAVSLLLLALAIPIPTIVFNEIAFPLQLFASRCAVWAMRMLDIPVLRDGNVIELLPLGSTTTKKLEVVEACSGIRSLMTLVTLAVVYAYFTQPKKDDKGGGGGGGGGSVRGWYGRNFGALRAVVIVLSAVPIAILTNAARVSGTGVLARYYGTEVADGFFHTFSGWIVYVLAFLLLFAFSWLIDRFDPNRGGGGKGGGRTESGAQTEDFKGGSQSGGEQVAVGSPSAAMSRGAGEVN